MLKIKDKTWLFSLKIEHGHSISATVCSKKVDHNQISNKRMFPRKWLASNCRETFETCPYRVAVSQR